MTNPPDGLGHFPGDLGHFPGPFGTLLANHTYKCILFFFCSDLLQSDDDEVLFGLAEEFSVLSDFIGSSDHLYLLVAPLEALASQEETVVRERVSSIFKPFTIIIR